MSLMVCRLQITHQSRLELEQRLRILATKSRQHLRMIGYQGIWSLFPALRLSLEYLETFESSTSLNAPPQFFFGSCSFPNSLLLLYP